MSRTNRTYGGGNRSTRRKPHTCRKSLTNFIPKCIEYTSPWAWFELTTLVVIGTDCVGSCNFNYHTITNTADPNNTIVISFNWLIMLLFYIYEINKNESFSVSATIQCLSVVETSNIITSDKMNHTLNTISF